MPQWNLGVRMRAAITAFKRPSLLNELISPIDWADYENRISRYAVLWAFYNNTAYEHKWSPAYKTNYALYQAIRSVYSMSNYIGNFHQTYIWGGAIDMLAGDGQDIESALPIITENEAIRPAIADIWKWSNWQVRKDIITLFGAVMGDVGIRVVDNPHKERVYFDIVHPATMTNLVKDEFGNIKSYVIEEEVEDPRGKKGTVIYKETAEHGMGNDIVFRTFLDGKPFAWGGEDSVSEWVETYGFIPMVHIQHIDINAGWGQSEAYAAQSKFRELDEQGSLQNDHVRKETAGLWGVSGTSIPTEIKVDKPTPTANNPMPSRERMRLINIGVDAKVESLVSKLDIDAVIHNIELIMKAAERELPELKLDDTDEYAATTGAALRVRQQPAANKIMLRRPNYDGALVNAQAMAMTIGAMGDYEAYSGLSVDGFANGDFDHSIGDRQVFKVDQADKLAQDKIFWETVNLAVTAGATLESALKNAGWTDEQINTMLRAQRREQSLNARRTAREAAQARLEQEQNGALTDITEEEEIAQPEAGQ
jgi:hypothetical protein